MKNFINKHLRKIIFIAVVALIIGAMFATTYFIKYKNYFNKESYENRYHTVVVTLNLISGAVVPIECYYYERIDTDRCINFFGISEKGSKVVIEVDKKYIIMVLTEEIDTQLKEISK